MNFYTKIESIHIHNTRQVENITFYKPRINYAAKFKEILLFASRQRGRVVNAPD